MTVDTRGSILLVEDHEQTRQSLAYILSQAGYSVDQLADGASAIQRLDASVAAGVSYDVILADLLLPVNTGLEVLKAARSLSNPPEVILITAYGTMSSAIDALREGARDYLLKPCDPEALLRSVAAALALCRERRQQQQALSAIRSNLQLLYPDDGPRAAEEEATPAIIIGPLTIELPAHKASLAGRVINLTPTEYKILTTLATTPGTVVSYKLLVQAVYHKEFEDQEAHQLIKTHIHNLRLKLGIGYIMNVRGIGYKLVDPKA
jgi:DNA-binding response OmpR family regulator